MFGKIGRAIGKYSGANLAVKGVKKLGAPVTAALAPMTLGGAVLAGVREALMLRSDLNNADKNVSHALKSLENSEPESNQWLT